MRLNWLTSRKLQSPASTCKLFNVLSQGLELGESRFQAL